MKKKLIALVIVGVLYMLIIGASYYLDYLWKINSDEIPRRYFDVSRNVPISSRTMSLFPKQFFTVFNLALYTLLIATPIFISNRLRRPWSLSLNIVYVLSLFIEVPIMYSNGGFNRWIVAGLNPWMNIFFERAVIIIILYQVWFFIYTLHEFLSRIKIEKQNVELISRDN